MSSLSISDIHTETQKVNVINPCRKQDQTEHQDTFCSTGPGEQDQPENCNQDNQSDPASSKCNKDRRSDHPNTCIEDRQPATSIQERRLDACIQDKETIKSGESDCCEANVHSEELKTGSEPKEESKYVNLS